MVGFLSGLFNRQPAGMLDGFDPMLGGDPRFGGGAAMAQLPGSAPRGSFGGKITDFFQQNPGMISALAAGIGSQPSFGQGFAEASRQMPQAMALDKASREKQRQRAAITALLKSQSMGTALPPEAMEVFEAYPELGAKFALDKMIPEPKEYGFEEVGGSLLRTDPTSGTAETVYGTSTPDAPDLETLYDEQTGMEYKG